MGRAEVWVKRVFWGGGGGVKSELGRWPPVAIIKEVLLIQYNNYYNVSFFIRTPKSFVANKVKYLETTKF